MTNDGPQLNEVSHEIRAIAKRLLNEGQVEVVIGFRSGTLPLRSTPHFARTAEEADLLVWDLGCATNLVKYLLDRQERAAIVAKGCDVRSVLAYAKENQIDRDRVTVVGVSCQGVTDRQKVDGLLDGRELLEAAEGGDHIVLRGRDFEKRVPRDDLCQDSCAACTLRNPVECDERVGKEVDFSPEAEEFAQIETLEARSADERWEWFQREFGRCIRCYACRNACPACYCEQCFVDHTRPEWIGKANDLADTLIFHLVRAHHSAGRCVDCGACERACPMTIPVRMLTRKVQKDVKEMFGHEAGVDRESAPPLAIHDPGDPEDFIAQ